MRPPKKWQFWFAAKMISRKYQKTIKYEIMVQEFLRATIKNELTIVTTCFFPKTVLFCLFFFPGKVDVGLTNAFSDGKQLFYWLTQIFGKGDQKQILPGKKTRCLCSRVIRFIIPSSKIHFNLYIWATPFYSKWSNNAQIH